LNANLEVDIAMESWSSEEKTNLPPKYGCTILLERASMEQLKDPSWPLDAYIIKYKIDDKIYMDLCRGSRVKIFDLYYDKFGTGVIQDIGWGYGKINPKLWGYKSPDSKKKR
jgi:hypothetical protein